jgi:hypothetical protein
MNERVTRLEVEAERTRADLDEIKTTQKTILQQIQKLPTKDDLTTWKLQWVGIGVGVIVLVVSLTFGGISVMIAALQGG